MSVTEVDRGLLVQLEVVKGKKDDNRWLCLSFQVIFQILCAHSQPRSTGMDENCIAAIFDMDKIDSYIIYPRPLYTRLVDNFNRAPHREAVKLQLTQNMSSESNISKRGVESMCRLGD